MRSVPSPYIGPVSLPLLPGSDLEVIPPVLHLSQAIREERPRSVQEHTFLLSLFEDQVDTKTWRQLASWVTPSTTDLWEQGCLTLARVLAYHVPAAELGSWPARLWRRRLDRDAGIPAEMVGWLIRGRRERDLLREGSLLWVDQLDIHPFLRGQRLASRLLDFACDEMLAGGGGVACLEAFPVQGYFGTRFEEGPSGFGADRLARYYASMGFEVCADADPTDGGVLMYRLFPAPLYGSGWANQHQLGALAFGAQAV